jgi:hypothetical protein
MEKAEKALWTFLMLALLGLELRTLYLDRDEHDSEQALARCQQLENFKEIANGLDTAISKGSAQFTATMGRMEGILTKQDETLTQTMGGTSFPLFIATLPTDPASIEMPVDVSARPKCFPCSHTPTPDDLAPLLDVTVDITEQPRTMKGITQSAVESAFHPVHYTLGTIIVPGDFTAPFKLEEGKRYTLQITTRHGSFREDIYTDRDANAPGGWRESWCMYGRRTTHKHGTVMSEERLLEGKCD